ncbi:hypothetical protein MmiAt1_13500 [Methanimicrococcus sp. At1]|uniref:GmrSD restriction endonucleases N-terminal domain-containing protein n=1 Tax=Methanimicrococcus hacksteinii TaxID=3028293 RepID=A0ABU3VQR8_9EURY|nr:DUF262 domain-containing protein [Methanimicrococcus sp. At1]MDV0445755.1 hypothetical protein [Methanimicrococcus sp. At1]
MTIQTKTVSEFKGCRFLVPAYQRGYRWTKHEVTALLNDVWEFSTEGDKKYCLQPLIVKKRDDDMFEVVDGQQRLTTIYIFMKIAAQKIQSVTLPFEIEYKTRENSATFLKSLSNNMDLKSEKKKNVDYFHIVSAYEAINEWFERQENKSVEIRELNKKMYENVSFIWHELPEDEDPIAMFRKVNLGKIPLTNAELIKALLLNRDNFTEKNVNTQIEISRSWDRIEQGLYNDSFWYFLNENDPNGTRIDMLFEVLAERQNDKSNNPILKQNYFAFLVFSSILNETNDKAQFVEKLWEEVEKLYFEFQDWYDDLDKYHIIGYLVASGIRVSEILNLTKGKRKSDGKKELLNKTKHTLEKYEPLSEISYEDKNVVKKILLLFNIATLVNKSEKQNRFPFEVYKKRFWDIEHIHAIADKSGDADDALWNLTLLDSKTNREPEYAAESFDVKRRIILERESEGLFVPTCTKNVFLKAYSSKPENMDIWKDEDKQNYIEEIEKTLDIFFRGDDFE